MNKTGLFDFSSSYQFARGKFNLGYSDIFPTLRTSPRMGIYLEQDLRIRKLTPLECWRLMGFDDEDYYKASEVCSKTQLYKQAGNSIVVNVLEAIFKELLLDEYVM